VQEVAFVEDHARVDAPPDNTEVGEAEIETVGREAGGGVTVLLMVTDMVDAFA
jgi:hypothetical protein